MYSIIPLLRELVLSDIVADCLDVSAKSGIDHKEGLLGVGVYEVAGVVVNSVVGIADAVATIDVKNHIATKLFHW